MDGRSKDVNRKRIRSGNRTDVAGCSEMAENREDSWRGDHFQGLADRLFGGRQLLNAGESTAERTSGCQNHRAGNRGAATTCRIADQAQSKRTKEQKGAVAIDSLP